MSENLTYEMILELFRQTDMKIKELTADTKELKETVKSIAEEHIKTEEAQLKTELAQLKTERVLQELAEDRKKTEELVRKVSSQMGDMHNKFGEYNEQLFLNSLRKLMQTKFKVQFFQPNYYRYLENVGGLEFDAFGMVNGNVNSIYLAEIKTKFSEKAVNQLKKNMEKFNTFYPELADKKKYGIIAAPYLKEEEKDMITENGFYPISIVGDIAEFVSPDDFIPTVYN